MFFVILSGREKAFFPDSDAVRSEYHDKENTETRPVHLPTNY